MHSSNPSGSSGRILSMLSCSLVHCWTLQNVPSASLLCWSSSTCSESCQWIVQRVRYFSYPGSAYECVSVHVIQKDVLASMQCGKLCAIPSGSLFWYVNRLISKEIYLQTTLNFCAEALFQVISIQETTCSSFYIPRQVHRWCKLRTRPWHEVTLQ